MLPRISRARLKVVDKSLEIGDGTDARPTEEEKAWFDLMASESEKDEIRRRRASICALCDVVSYHDEEFTFLYDEKAYTVKKPLRPFDIAKAYSQGGAMAALQALNNERRIMRVAVPIQKDFTDVDAPLIKLLSEVTENFFFAPYL